MCNGGKSKTARNGGEYDERPPTGCRGFYYAMIRPSKIVFKRVLYCHRVITPTGAETRRTGRESEQRPTPENIPRSGQAAEGRGSPLRFAKIDKSVNQNYFYKKSQGLSATFRKTDLFFSLSAVGVNGVNAFLALTLPLTPLKPLLLQGLCHSVSILL